MSCAIIDYGSGNLHSAVKSFERTVRENDLDTKIILTDNPAQIQTADHIVLPGVGAYGDCLAGLQAIDGLLDALEDVVRVKTRPFLGICVGMQLMSTEGHEHQVTKGLNWIEGEVRAIEPNDKSLKIPHMGWNNLSFSASDCPPATAESASDAYNTTKNHPALESIKIGPDGLHAYFVHSYQFVVKNPADRLLITDYGGEVTAMVAKDNMIGTQFHPEKSQTLGLKLINNFLQWKP